ncbi:hypothetical protein [Mesorhizobium sp. LSHC412B00]|uniref:hypothetical protein n=1 Tax=Mesorhizobium sp. LSHC412B00 TaxID=1287285 RepID=UPI0012EC0920|nr:hypothetical protein [Mesorhizobium sp. LSHC412B00]
MAYPRRSGGSSSATSSKSFINIAIRESVGREKLKEEPERNGDTFGAAIPDYMEPEFARDEVVCVFQKFADSHSANSRTAISVITAQ